MNGEQYAFGLASCFQSFNYEVEGVDVAKVAPYQEGKHHDRLEEVLEHGRVPRRFKTLTGTFPIDRSAQPVEMCTGSA